MNKKRLLPLLFIVPVFLLACTLTILPTGLGNPTDTIGAPAGGSPTSTNEPTPTLTTAPPAGPAPVSIPASSAYIDDRSTPSQVIVSLYNAISRHEYVRAYGYWGDPLGSLGAYDAWAAGYSDTASVDLVFGQIFGDPGMSQVRFIVPVVLKVTKADSSHANYSACYIVHFTNPLVYGAPPVSPMNIEHGSAVASDPGASDAYVLATTCSSWPTTGLDGFSASANTTAIDTSNFVDNRSGAVETVSSLLNSINLHQYVRAYSYFRDPATFPGPYDTFAAGYADTNTLTATFGAVQSEGAAGSQYYKVPLAEVVQTVSSGTKTYVGCYTLRLTNPSIQGAPPFEPMGIIAGTFTLVPNGTDVTPLLVTACD